jgi:UPF0755 protein
VVKLKRLVLVVTLMLVVGVFVSAHPITAMGRPILFTIHQGDSVGKIDSALEARGVILSAFLFRVDSLVEGTPTFRAGSYEIETNSSFAHVRSVFSGLPNAQAVVVNPGTTLHLLAQQIAGVRGGDFAARFLQEATALASTSPWHPRHSLEGLLGPGQYVLQLGETPAHLVARMAASFDSWAGRLGLSPSGHYNGLSAYQVVIAASIVEKEGYYPINMPKVARVILNRLRRGGGLQMDATILYYFQQDGGAVTHAMLRVPTPYNTYLSPGLTPTPICMPSAIALTAMLHPPAGKWLYFTLVSQDGTMAFSNTFAEQLANERLAASRGIG